MKDVPTITLAKGSNWQVDIVLYPSGAYLECVERQANGMGRLVYSEIVTNVVRAARVLAKKHGQDYIDVRETRSSD